MSFDSLDVDSLLRVLSFMNAQCLARISSGSRLGSVAAFEAQQRPALLVVKGQLEELSRCLPHKLSARPTVAFVQYSGDKYTGDEIISFVRQRLPSETQVLGAATDNIQCALDGMVDTPSKAASTELKVSCGNEPEEVGLLVATFPEAQAYPFHLTPENLTPDLCAFSSEEDSDSDEEEFSSAASGIQDQDVSEVDDFQEAEDVDEEESRTSTNRVPSTAQAWVESLENSNEEQAIPEPPASAGVIDAHPAENDMSCRTDQSKKTKKDPLKQLLSLDPPPKVVILHVAMRASSVVRQIQCKYPEAAIIGGVVMGGEVMVHGGGTSSCGRGIGALAISGNAPLFAMTSPFAGTAKLATNDVRRKMKLAQDIAIAKERRILGALLFTCNARGRGMFGREGHDAHLFHEQFPHAPLLGYYAGGEVGPAVQDDDEVEGFQSGNAGTHGFTAVYGFFLVPRRQTPSVQFQRAVLYGEVQEAFLESHPAKMQKLSPHTCTPARPSTA